MRTRALLIVPLALASTQPALADSSGVTWVPTQDGGMTYYVDAKGFEINYASYGRRTNQGYDVPMSGQLRSGCFVATPFLPVSHGDGLASFIPNAHFRWDVVLHPSQVRSAPYMSIDMEIKRSGSSHHVSAGMDLSMMDLREIYRFDDGNVQYAATLDVSPDDVQPRVMTQFGVESGDEIRVRFCNLAEGGSMLLREMRVETEPNRSHQ